MLYLGQGKRQPGVSLCWGSKGSDLHMELLPEVAVLRVRRVPQLLLLLLVPHRAAAEHRHLRHRLLLQLLQRAASGAEQLPNKVELELREGKSKDDRRLPWGAPSLGWTPWPTA